VTPQSLSIGEGHLQSFSVEGPAAARRVMSFDGGGRVPAAMEGRDRRGLERSRGSGARSCFGLPAFGRISERMRNWSRARKHNRK